MSAGAPNEFRVGPDSDPDYYVIDARPVATGTEGILYRGSLTAGRTELDVAVKMLQPCFLDRVDEWFPRWCEQVELLRSLRSPESWVCATAFSDRCRICPARRPGTGRCTWS